MNGRSDLATQLRLVAITPDTGDPSVERMERLVEPVLSAGVRCIQYRNKHLLAPHQHRELANALNRCCRRFGALLVINDHVELALECGADGVHVGPNDRPVAQVRALVGGDMLIGGSAGTLEAALALVESGADYLGVGAIFDARASKADASAPRGTELLTRLRRHPGLAGVPIVAIGGVDATNARLCVDAGADGVAAIRAFFASPGAASEMERSLR
jgi:thiamine-phosphate pyrophosphorylase